MILRHNIPRIDDPFDAANEAYPREDGMVTVDVALRIGKGLPLIAPLATLVAEARDYFSKKATNERLEVLIAAVNEKTEHLANRVEENSELIADVRLRMQSREFVEAFREASVQTLFISDRKKIRDFGAILGNSVSAETWLEVSSELSTFVKAISQLGEKDVEVLRLLQSVFAEVITGYPNMHDPNPFTERISDLLKAVQKAGFHPESFYSHCRRLEGFGLAMEVLRNTSRMALGDYCFRPTRLGLNLLNLLTPK
jgi:hypothetical protein